MHLIFLQKNSKSMLTFVCAEMSRMLCSYVAENVLSIRLTIIQKASVLRHTHVFMC